MQQGFSISPLGDGALVVSFGNAIAEELNRNVLQVFHRIKAASLPFVTDVVPAYASLAVYYDILSLQSKQKSAYDRMREMLLAYLQETKNDEKTTGRSIAIPVCYAKKYAFDLEELAAQKALSLGDVVQLHTAKIYRVYMVGFLPGFPYMGSVDNRIAAPRRNIPRTSVPAGSVGIAGAQTGIYSLDSPGGWNIIGRTPLKVFDATISNPVLLQSGDNVNFVSITEDEFESY